MMQRNTRITITAISTMAGICLVVILVLQLAGNFYFGQEMETFNVRALTLENKLSLKNSLPCWFYAGKTGYELLFTANLTGDNGKDIKEGYAYGDGAPLMLVAVDPIKKEIVQAENNIYKNNVDNGVNTFLTDGDTYRSIPLENGIMVFEDNREYIGYSAYYTFSHSSGPMKSARGKPLLAYITHRGIFSKPGLVVKALTGGLFFTSGQQQQEMFLPIPAAALLGWNGDREIYYSSARLNSSFQYIDMHDLWSVPVYGGQPRKLADNVYTPVFNRQGAEIVFLRSEKKDSYSLWMLKSDGGLKKLTRFSYTSREHTLPPIEISAMRGSSDFEVCYAADGENGLKSMIALDVSTGRERTLAKDKQEVGPIISSAGVDGGLGKYILYFAGEDGKKKAYVIDRDGNVQSEIYDLLQSAPAEPYFKGAAEGK